MIILASSDNPWLQVSKSWNVLALDGSNWQKVDLFEFQVELNLLHPFAFECFHLQKSTLAKVIFFVFKEDFNISFQVDVEGIVVENLARRCGGVLKSLSLNGCQVLF